jgi:hypothetical protein
MASKFRPEVSLDTQYRDLGTAIGLLEADILSTRRATGGLRFATATLENTMLAMSRQLTDITRSTGTLKESNAVLANALGKYKDGVIGSTAIFLKDAQISGQIIETKKLELQKTQTAMATRLTQKSNLEKLRETMETPATGPSAGRTMHSMVTAYEATKEKQAEIAQRERARSREISLQTAIKEEQDRIINNPRSTRAEKATATAAKDSAQDIITTITGKRAKEKVEKIELRNALTEETELAGSALKKFITKYNESVDDADKLSTNVTDIGSTYKLLQNKLKENGKVLETLTDEEKKLAYELKETKINEFFNPLRKYLDTLGNALTSLVAGVRETQQQFGIAADQAAQVKIDNVMASITSYVDSLKSGFSKVAVTAEQIAKTQSDFQSEFGGVLTSEAAKQLAEQATRLGVTTAQLATARRVFMTQSMGDIGGAVRMQDKLFTQFKQSGLTNKDAMEAVAKYSELYARNGIRFADSLNRAAADAKKIGVDLSKVDQVGDSIIDNFEGYLEKQSELGAMGFNFDSNRIAQIAETGDTGALFRELRSQLAATGKDITNLRRSEQLALSSAFGIPISELQRMAAGTDGSGEELLTDQQKGNKTLVSILNALTILGTIMSGISGILGIVHSALLHKIAMRIGAPMPAGLATAGRLGAGAAGLGIGIGGALMGREMVKGGNVGGGLATGALAGGIGATMLALTLAPATGGMSLLALGALGAGAGTLLAASGKGDDVISQAGYGERSLVTPTGVVALNNEDNIVSYADDMVSTNTGLQMLSKGSIAENVRSNTPTQVNVDMSALENKLDQVVRAIGGMQVNMDSTKVGRVLINNSDTGGSVGVMRTQNLQTF